MDGSLPTGSRNAYLKKKKVAGEGMPGSVLLNYISQFPLEEPSTTVHTDVSILVICKTAKK